MVVPFAKVQPGAGAGFAANAGATLMDIIATTMATTVINIDIRVQSPDSESEVQKVYEAWRERCPIYLALTKAMEVSLSTETTQA